MRASRRARLARARGVPAWLVADLGLAALALALRLPGLDGQLWLDEISALRGYRRSFLETLTIFPPFFPNPLYELLAHASILALGESALAIRLPALGFGVAGVIAFHHLVRQRASAGEAVFAAALLAVSYHHVYYSQDARGYTLWLCFTLIATLFALRWLDGARGALGWAASATLGAYGHPFGIFVLAGQGALLLGVATWRDGAAAARRVAAVVAGAGLATLALYAPLAPSALSYAATEARQAAHGPRVLELLPELLEGLGVALGGPPGLAVAALLLALGGVDALRRAPVLVALLVVPVALSAVAILLLGAGVHPRYFLPGLALGVLAGARGLVRVGELALRGLRRPPARARAGLAVAATLAVVAAALPLRGYYALPKQDYRGALRFATEHARAGDAIVAADLAGLAVTRWYDPGVPLVEDLATLRGIEAGAARVFVLTTLERVMRDRAPDLWAHLHARYERVAWLPGSVGDGALRVYVGPRAAPEPQSGSAKATR